MLILEKNDSQSRVRLTIVKDLKVWTKWYASKKAQMIAILCMHIVSAIPRSLNLVVIIVKIKFKLLQKITLII